MSTLLGVLAVFRQNPKGGRPTIEYHLAIRDGVSHKVVKNPWQALLGKIPEQTGRRGFHRN
jgi:hypothetical protein